MPEIVSLIVRVVLPIGALAFVFACPELLGCLLVLFLLTAMVQHCPEGRLERRVRRQVAQLRRHV